MVCKKEKKKRVEIWRKNRNKKKKKIGKKRHGLMNRVFANGPEDQGSIPGQVIPKTLKWYLMPFCLTLSTIR